MRALTLGTLLALLALPACGQERAPARQASEAAAPPAQAPPPSATPAAAPAPAQTGRTVAVTFDDLPGVGRGGLAGLQAINTGLLAQIRAAGMPAVGFVNEGKLAPPAQAAARTALLERWLQAGLELGNHTYSHRSFYRTPLAEYQADVLRGERVTRRLMEERGRRPRYFRHPFLNTGPNLETKAAFERFLGEHGYRVAPVTLDNDEWIYAGAYINASARGDSAAMRRIGADYVRYMGESFAFFERLSRELLRREPAQVLLLHANALNAEYPDELTAMMKARGYRFVPLETALADPVYALPDRYAGRSGLSWLERWAITQGRKPGTPPAVPRWVRTAAGVTDD